MNCCLCGKILIEYGYTALPVSEGLCCGKCFKEKVKPAQDLDKTYQNKIKNDD